MNIYEVVNSNFIRSQQLRIVTSREIIKIKLHKFQQRKGEKELRGIFEVLITIPSILLKKIWRDKFNNIKKS